MGIHFCWVKATMKCAQHYNIAPFQRRSLTALVLQQCNTTVQRQSTQAHTISGIARWSLQFGNEVKCTSSRASSTSRREMSKGILRKKKGGVYTRRAVEGSVLVLQKSNPTPC